MRNSLCLNHVLNDNISVLSRCMCLRERGSFLVISMAECVVETFTIHSYNSSFAVIYDQLFIMLI